MQMKSSPIRSTQLRIENTTRNTSLATHAELADTAKTRKKGLLGRKCLQPGEALWIVPCESVHTFFMKFPIDLVYIDRNKKVKKVRSNVGPWRLSACLSAHSIIELPAGIARASQTEPGDQLAFSSADAEASETGDSYLKYPVTL